MGKTIKGITVEINGKTTGLGAALKEVDKHANGLASNLQAVNKALKLDPSNTELLAEKQKILAASVDAAREKLKTLEEVQDQIRQQYASGEIDQGAYLDFQNELEYTRSKLERLEKQQKDFGTVAQQQMKLAAEKVEEFGNKVSNVGDKVSGAGEKMMPATAGIVALGTAAVSLGSDLEESQNKVNVAFGNSADQVHAFAETTLEQYGIAAGTTLEMASLFGDMATSMKIPQDEAANMSTSLVGLAGDLASFKNIGLDDARSALKGIFTGETESLKNLGIVMTQTNLDAYALASGMGKTTSEMTEAEKVQLRYAYVMEQTKNAQGDFARTSDGAANSMRTAQEAIKECGASFGTMLTPYVAQITQYLTQLIKGFTQLPEEQKKTILTIAAIVAAVGPVLTIGGKLISGIGSFISLIGSLGTAMSFLAANPVVLIIAAIAALGTGLVAAYNNCEGFRNGVNSVIESVKQKWTDGVENIKSVLANLKEGWNNTVNAVASWTETAMSAAKEAWNNTLTTISNITDVTMTAVKATMQERMSSIRSAYEENGGGLRGIAAATMSAIEGYYTDGWKVVDKLTGGKLSEIAAGIKSKMEEARQAVANAIEKIKSIFNFEWNWPKLKLPHFSINGRFSLDPPSIPTVGVSWYAKGCILNGAQIFGALGNTLLGGGEAGPEAVLPLNSFYDNIRSILGHFLGSGAMRSLQVLLNIEHFENYSDRDLDELVEYVEDKLYTKITQKEAALT